MVLSHVHAKFRLKKTNIESLTCITKVDALYADMTEQSALILQLINNTVKVFRFKVNIYIFWDNFHLNI